MSQPVIERPAAVCRFVWRSLRLCHTAHRGLSILVRMMCLAGLVAGVSLSTPTSASTIPSSTTDSISVLTMERLVADPMEASLRAMGRTSGGSNLLVMAAPPSLLTPSDSNVSNSRLATCTATEGWGVLNQNGAALVNNYGSAHGIAPVVNGQGSLPQPGDVVSFSVESNFTDGGGEYPGHVAIVTAVSSSRVTILSENWAGQAQSASLPVSNGSIEPIQTENAQGTLVTTPYIDWLPLAGRGSAVPGPGDFGSFNRYVGANGHYETTRAQPPGYSFEAPLGELLMTNVPGDQPLYSCIQGTDEFTSDSSNCEGQTVIGFEGYGYSSQPPGLATVPLYRCRVTSNNTHFDSNDPACEGQTSDGFLAYLLGASSFNRYVGANGHYETTRAQPPGYSFEAPLGELLMDRRFRATSPYTAAYKAPTSSHRTRRNCEGQTVIGFEGYGYSSQPPDWPPFPSTGVGSRPTTLTSTPTTRRARARLPTASWRTSWARVPSIATSAPTATTRPPELNPPATPSRLPWASS